MLEYLSPINLRQAADILIENVVNVQDSKKIVITCDNNTDFGLLKVAKNSVIKQGSKCEILKHQPSEYPCKELPSSVEKVILSSDVWLEFSAVYSLYSSTYNKAVNNGCHYVCLPGMDTDMAIRMLCGVNHEILSKMAFKLNQISQNSKKFRLTSTKGSDFSVEIDPKISKFDIPYGEQNGGFGQMLGGQIGFSIYPKTLNGCLVLDGTIWPPQAINIPKEPVTLTVASGEIINIIGGKEAYLLEKWLKQFNNHSMFKIDHICYGFHPKVKQLTGKILEDERLWGCIQIGIGRISEGAPSHCDAIIKFPSIWLDNSKIEEEGKYLHRDLVKLASCLF